MYKIRISDGYASYLLDITDNWFLCSFIKEANQAYDAFIDIDENISENKFESKENIPFEE